MVFPRLGDTVDPVCHQTGSCLIEVVLQLGEHVRDVQVLGVRLVVAAHFQGQLKWYVPLAIADGALALSAAHSGETRPSTDCDRTVCLDSRGDRVAASGGIAEVRQGEHEAKDHAEGMAFRRESAPASKLQREIPAQQDAHDAAGTRGRILVINATRECVFGAPSTLFCDAPSGCADSQCARHSNCWPATARMSRAAGPGHASSHLAIVEVRNVAAVETAWKAWSVIKLRRSTAPTNHGRFGVLPETRMQRFGIGQPRPWN